MNTITKLIDAICCFIYGHTKLQMPSGHNLIEWFDKDIVIKINVCSRCGAVYSEK